MNYDFQVPIAEIDTCMCSISYDSSLHVTEILECTSGSTLISSAEGAEDSQKSLG